MAKGVQITSIGVKELQRKFGKLADLAITNADAEMSSISVEFVNDAVTAAPADQGLLRNSITHEKRGVMNHVITSAAPYSAYQEFGTGSLVRVPSEWKEFALQFKGKGIREVNIKPHPFFFVQVPKARAKLRKQIPQAIAKAMK